MGRRPIPPSGSNTTAFDLDPVHRKFLASSLDRNDTELMAIEKLHGQLRELRCLIVERYGELSLFPSDDVNSNKVPVVVDEEKENLLLAFRLRLKLRRKLLNRLTRRLNRVAHFMDGEVSNVVAPPNPKYGDLRYEFNTDRFEQYEQLTLKTEQALDVLREKRRMLDDNPAKKYSIDAHDTLCVLEINTTDIYEQHQQDQDEEKAAAYVAIPLSDLMEYDVGYNTLKDDEKPITSNNLTDQDTPEYASIKFGAGIGAAHKSMSNKEKEVEYARWSQDVLARTPEQPTFEQLGMGDTQVFFLEERKKILLEQENEKYEKQKHENDDDDTSSDEEDGMKVDEQEIEPAEDSSMHDDTKPSLLPNDDTQPEEMPKKKVYLTLSPVPSFAQQDLRRIRSIQADFVMAALFKQYKAKIDESTRDYNDTVARSTELQNLKIRLQSDLHKVILHGRSIAQKTRSDYAMDVAIARAKWQRRREHWEAAQLARKRSRNDPNIRHEIIHTLRLMVDQVERRTLYDMNNYNNAPKGTTITPREVVAQCVKVTVKDLVNTVVDRQSAPTNVRGEIRFSPTNTVKEWNYDLLGDTFEDFVPPPPSTEIDQYASSKKQEEQETTLRRQMAAVETRFTASEEDRKRVWRKLQKLRTEMDPQQQPHLSVQGSSIQQQQQQQSFGVNVNRPRMAAPSTSVSQYHLAQKQQAPPSSSNPQHSIMTRPPMAKMVSPAPVAAMASVATVPAPAVPAPAVEPAPAPYNYPSMDVSAGTIAASAARQQQLASTVGVPEALVAAYALAVEAAESSDTLFAQQPDGVEGQTYVKSVDKYGGKYSMEKVRERIFPDGSVVPVQAPKRNKDGLYQRPAGRQRKGMDWDAERGVWIPLPGYPQEAHPGNKDGQDI